MTDYSLFEGLKILVETAFPKHCICCGRRFETAAQFFTDTQQLHNGSGLKQSYDDNNSVLIEVYRNCPCGSTLMDYFSDRRDLSAAGLKRRELFGNTLKKIIATTGWPYEQARSELLAYLRGEPCTELDSFLLREKNGSAKASFLCNEKEE